MIRDRQRLVTDAEVLQGILYRHVSINRRDAIQPAFDVLLRVTDQVYPVDVETASRAQEIVMGHPTFPHGTLFIWRSWNGTKAGFLGTYGSVPSTIVGNAASIFSYTSTSTTANISWSSFELYFSDGTTATISSGSQSVTGLTAGTYYYYPYVAAGATTVSFVTGGSGTPGILFNPQSATAAQAQNAQNVTALSVGSITIIVTTGGSGSGGGSGRCCRSNMIVQDRVRGNVPLGSCKPGDYLIGRDGWMEILQFKLVPQKHFVRLTTKEDGAVEITLSHHITVIRNEGEQSVQATALNLHDFLVTKTGYAALKSIEFIEDPLGEKVVMTVSKPHTFFAGDETPSILVSNAVPIS